MGGARNSVKNLLNGHEIKIKLNFTWVTSRTWHVVSVSHGTWPRAAPDTKTLFFNFENSFFGFIPCPDRYTNTGTATSVGLHLCYRLETGDWWHYLGWAVSGSLGSFPGLSLVTLTTSMPLIGWLGPDLTRTQITAYFENSLPPIMSYWRGFYPNFPRSYSVLTPNQIVHVHHNANYHVS